MEVTINDVVNAVVQAIEEAFPQISVLSEDNAGQPDDPRFFVQLLELTHTQEYGNRYRRIYPFLIRYEYPAGSNEDKYDKAEQLTSALKEITISAQKVHAQLMRCQIVDGNLQFNATYSLLMREQQPTPPYMRSLQQEEYINEK